jgi:hypothetical protein
LPFVVGGACAASDEAIRTMTAEATVAVTKRSLTRHLQLKGEITPTRSNVKEKRGMVRLVPSTVLLVDDQPEILTTLTRFLAM